MPDEMRETQPRNQAKKSATLQKQGAGGEGRPKASEVAEYNFHL